MTSSTAKRIQLFVAGSLAIIGLEALEWAPRYILVSRDTAAVLASLAAGLALPLGVAILLGSLRGIRLAEFYLWLQVVGSCAVLLISALHLFPPNAPHASWASAARMVAPVLLLTLLVWSRFAPHGADT